ncbi:hypothetical protein SAMN04487886_11069 [Clostridium sp. DSM 8431]|uniref:hypothetical protein n=1 Tax=Clostridium sp. DSM 8431 TaxID=1761781 RepID=UPI0008E7C448|nr:hypothetical protein [Clostridium sp. DSM 8431]SFU69547.1 hypothetical protein SAMN04487886_11069 [Clostridium sp. DSM 8431]
MELFIYKTFNDWYNDTVTEVLEGEIRNLYNGLIAVDTFIDGKSYRQLFSTKNNFAILYKMPCGFLSSSVEINIYLDVSSWQNSNPEISFKGQVIEDECSEGRCVFINEDGFKHYISLDDIYAITYER